MKFKKGIIQFTAISIVLLFIIGSTPRFDAFITVSSVDNKNIFSLSTSWANATVISDDPTGWNNGDSWYPAIAIDSAGNVHVVWEDWTIGEWGTDIEIMYANYTAMGWSNATVISDDATGWNTETSYDPDIAIDGDGNVHVVWYDDTDSVGEWGTDLEIMYANRTGAGWSNATVISDDATGWNDGSSLYPDIAIDGNGNVHVVWGDATNGEWGSDSEIMYSKKSAPSSPQTPSEESPVYLIGQQGGGDISSFLLSPLGLGIIAGFGAMFLILVVIVINNNKTIKELKKIIKTPTSKKSIEK
ncbi:MAG: hypothetical protein HWN67_20590 [Candidatus Helarchaeota archaeon]|nr:hypothetical protein [Candidatus Helarchaeota archaeon]